MTIKIKLINTMLAATFTALFACTPAESEKVAKPAQAIEESDECHLCGMIIENFAGPKGQLFHRHDTQTRKFCSTRDLLSYYFDPENKRNVVEIYVHDMAKMPWDVLDDSHFIDGRQAWYVLGSEKRGAMGATLGSFASKKDAKAFADEFGGDVKHFDELSLAVL